MENLSKKDWHNLPSNEVVKLLETSPEKGLDINEAEDRRRQETNQETNQGNQSGTPLSF